MAASKEPNFDQVCDRLNISEALRKHVAPDAAPRGKLAVARGMLPAPPKVLLAMRFLLLGDKARKVAKAAEAGILEIPEDRMIGLIDPKTHPKLLEFLVYQRSDDALLMERCVLLRQINDKSICYLAETAGERVTDIIANNQERLITTPQLLRFLERNPSASRALVDRVRSFQRLYQVDLPEPTEEELAAAAAAHARRVASSGAAPQPDVNDGDPTTSDPPRSSGGAGGVAPSGQDPGGGTPAPVPLAAAGAAAMGRPAASSLPSDFVRGAVYIPEAPTEPYKPPPGLLNPFSALFADWGIQATSEHLAPPDHWVDDTVGAPIYSQPPVHGAGEATSATAGQAAPAQVAQAVMNTRDIIDIDDVDVSGMTSLSESSFSFSLSEAQDDFASEFTDDSAGGGDELKASINQQINGMTTGQKIKLAYKGNKSVRELLVRDTNKIVAVAVVKSGRITDNEVISIATNRAVNEDVIRALSENREYVRKYPVKVALVNNPKTPIPTAMSMLKSLHVGDLKKLSTNRNVSSAIFTQASKLYKQKKKIG